MSGVGRSRSAGTWYCPTCKAPGKNGMKGCYVRGYQIPTDSTLCYPEHLNRTEQIKYDRHLMEVR